MPTLSLITTRPNGSSELACPHDRKHIAQLGLGHCHQHGVAVGLEPGEEERINRRYFLGIRFRHRWLGQCDKRR